MSTRPGRAATDEHLLNVTTENADRILTALGLKRATGKLAAGTWAPLNVDVRDYDRGDWLDKSGTIVRDEDVAKYAIVIMPKEGVRFESYMDTTVAIDGGIWVDYYDAQLKPGGDFDSFVAKVRDTIAYRAATANR